MADNPGPRLLGVFLWGLIFLFTKLVVGTAYGEPILIVSDSSYSSNPFGYYLTEILLSEGLVEFQHTEKANLMAEDDPLEYLSNYQVVILAEMSLNSTEEQLLRDYVDDGGNLIAMRPDTDLDDLFGISYSSTRTEALQQFFAFNTSSGPGFGIVDESLQYHGVADNYTLSGATSLADLYNDISTPSSNPAVVINNYGSGQAVAFTFDLAKNIVLMRQGNLAWKNIDGDGTDRYRPFDLFKNGTSVYFSYDRITIPQADEQQRFLANLIMSLSSGPLPRMWYLPGLHKTLVVPTGDGEGEYGDVIEHPMNDVAGYGGHFTAYLREAGITGTSVAQEASWRAAGHEVGVHFYGTDYTNYSVMNSGYATIVNALNSKFGHLSRTCRNHALSWTGWSDMAEIELNHGTQLDTNYYWSGQIPYGYNGYYTGSGLPQRFSDEAGNILDIYQALTEWPDEWFIGKSLTLEQATQIVIDMIQLAENNGYYSTFVMNSHPPGYDKQITICHDWSNNIWAYCQTNGIPMWTAEMLLDFVQARNDVQFDNLAWDIDPSQNNAILTFDFNTSAAGQDLTLMIPTQTAQGSLLHINKDSNPISFAIDEIKGLSYALFTTTDDNNQIAALYGNNGILHVPADYGTIQEAIDAAFVGDTVIVEPNTYLENINFKGKDIILTSTNPTDPDIVASTVIDGGGLDTTVRFAGSESADCQLRGFTITGGSGPGLDGGGIHGNCALAAISYCNITDNTSANKGAGIKIIYGTISNCQVTDNTSGDLGGGLAGCMGTISNCVIAGNTATNIGGGLCNCDGTIINCTIVNNSATTGGGLTDCDGSITNCVIWGNTPDQLDSGAYSVTYSCVQQTVSGDGNINSDPLLVPGRLGDYYLSQTASGQSADSPCLEAGNDSAVNLGMDNYTTRTDNVSDEDTIDMGYHYTSNIADLDQDGQVDQADLVIFASQWLTTPGTPSADLVPLTGDDFVDLRDFDIIAKNWLWDQP